MMKPDPALTGSLAGSPTRSNSRPFRLAERVGRIEPFQVMELGKRAARLAEAGHPVIHLNIGEPDFTAPPAVVSALRRAVEAGLTQYTASTGLEALRRAIAGDYRRRYGLEIDPDRVIVTPGASGALQLACCALIDPGSQVLMADPGYPCNRHFVAASDGVPVSIPVGPESRYQLSRELVARHWNPAVRGVLLASPANPTGTSIPIDELRGIVQECRARGGFTLVDEIYLGLSYGAPPASALTLGDDLIVINSFSKYFNMTGWRLGWMIVPQALVPVFEKLAQNLFICASSLAQHAALACFEPETLAVYEQRREAFGRRRDFIVPALRSLGLEVPVTPEGAFFVYVDCSRFSEDSTAFADSLLQQQYVAVVPGHDFGQHRPERHLRLSYANSMENLERAVERIGRFLKTA